MAMVEELLELEDKSTLVVDFAYVTKKGTSVGAPPPDQISGFAPAKHGNWAQWGAVIISLGIGVLNICLLISYHNSANAATATDDHIARLVGDQLTPAIKGINDNVGKSIEPINKHLDDLSQQVAKLQGRFDQLDSEQKKASLRLDRQEALNRLEDPNRILATIQAEIQMAEEGKGTVSQLQLADYRAALFTLPPSAAQYWKTMAAVINYQSLVNQLSGEAPDPVRVSRPCGGLTGGIGNVYGSFQYSNCVVDLDTQVFSNGTFRNCVIRYRGAATSLLNVKFINCRFVLDLTAQPSSTVGKNLLFALLNSPDQKTVQIPR
jgi:hypothetical protein